MHTNNSRVGAAFQGQSFPWVKALTFPTFGVPIDDMGSESRVSHRDCNEHRLGRSQQSARAVEASAFNAGVRHKPMCLTRQEVEAIIKARDEAGVQVMVGYMRRYAPAFVQAVEQVRALEKITYARVRDIIGQNAQFVEQSSVVLRPKDIPQEAMSDRAERASRLVKAAIGEAPPELVRTYRLLCGLSSHDLSAMRELLGMPRGVIAARQWGLFLTALFDYESFTVTFETGIDHNRRFDAHLTVYSETKEIRVQYDTPYIRQLPTRLFINETQGEAFEERVIRPTFTDAYTVELHHFYEVVSQNMLPKTTAEDFLNDLDLFKMIINALRE